MRAMDRGHMHEGNKAFVERLFARKRDALQAFFYRRFRTNSDAADLAQEVYLRMLRVSDTDAVRNPDAYLYTVVSNLLKENAVAERRQAVATGLDDVDGALQVSDWPDIAASIIDHAGVPPLSGRSAPHALP